MSHDRGCFKCGDDLPDGKTCTKTDCPYKLQNVQLDRPLTGSNPVDVFITIMQGTGYAFAPGELESLQVARAWLEEPVPTNPYQSGVAQAMKLIREEAAIMLKEPSGMYRKEDVIREVITRIYHRVNQHYGSIK